MTRRPRAIRTIALIVGMLGWWGCDTGSFSDPPAAAACAQIGSQCQLPDGPLGVCQEVPCGAGAERPCFKCTSQH